MEKKEKEQSEQEAVELKYAEEKLRQKPRVPELNLSLKSS